MPKSPWRRLRRIHRGRHTRNEIDVKDSRPGLATLTIDVAETATRLYTTLIKTPHLACEACGRATPPGHTAYILDDEHHYGHLICYHCGTVIADVIGLTPITDPPDAPAYGGGHKHLSR